METELHPQEIQDFNSDLKVVFDEWKMEEQTRDTESKFDSRYQIAMRELIETVMESKGYSLELVVRRIESHLPGMDNSKDLDEFDKKESLGADKFKIIAERYGYEIGDPRRPWVVMSEGRPGLVIQESRYKPSLIFHANEIESLRFVSSES